MARWAEPDAAIEAEWTSWVASLPPKVRVVAEKFFPWLLYRMKGTGQRVVVYSFDEGTDDLVSLRVSVSGQFNLVVCERIVFGIAPEDLEECDLPGPKEIVGTLDVDPEAAFAAMSACEAPGASSVTFTPTLDPKTEKGDVN